MTRDEVQQNNHSMFAHDFYYGHWNRNGAANAGD